MREHPTPAELGVEPAENARPPSVGELIRAALDAARREHHQAPTRESAMVVTKLDEAQMWNDRFRPPARAVPA